MTDIKYDDQIYVPYRHRVVTFSGGIYHIAMCVAAAAGKLRWKASDRGRAGIRPAINSGSIFAGAHPLARSLSGWRDIATRLSTG